MEIGGPPTYGAVRVAIADDSVGESRVSGVARLVAVAIFAVFFVFAKLAIGHTVADAI